MKKFLLLKLMMLTVLAVFSVKVGAQALFQEVTGTGLPILGRNCAVAGDYNNDGKMDLLIVSPTFAGIYKNNGNNVFQVAVTLLPGGLANGSCAWGDYNNDGYLDALVAGDGGTGVGIVTKLFKNNGDGTFTEQKQLALMGMYYGTVSFVDYNNDGFLDIHVIGRIHSVHQRANGNRLYRNNRNGTFSEVGGTKITAGSSNSFQYTTDLFNYQGWPTTGAYSWGPHSGSDAYAAWGDFNNDGYPDLIESGYPDSKTPNFLSDGKGGFTPISAVTTSSLGGNGLPVLQVSSSVILADFNNDGVLDAVVGGSNKKLSVFKNSGTAPNYSFALQMDLVTSTGALGLIANSIAVADFDNDGDLDIAVQYNDAATTSGTTKIFINNGYAASPQFTALDATQFPISQGYRWGSCIWADFDNDGLLDLLLTGQEGTGTTGQVRLFKNISGATANGAITAPTTLSQTVGTSDAVLSWDNAIDPVQGKFVSYNLRVGTSSGGTNIVNPSVNPNGSRQLSIPGRIQQAFIAPGTAATLTNFPLKNLAPGTYYWSVQAIDNSFSSSAWAPEQSFVITAKQASNIKFNTFSPGTVTITWDKGSNGNSAVFIDTFNIYRGAYGVNNPSDKKTDFPLLVNDTTFTPNTTFGTSTSKFRTTGWHCIYNGTNNSVTVTGLTRTDILRYSVAVIDYSGSAGSEQYNLNMEAGNPQIIPPTINSRNVTTSNITLGGFTATWNNAFINQTIAGNANYLNAIQGFGRAVFVKEGTSAQNLNIPVVNDTIYTANTNMGLGSQIGNSGWYCVYNGFSPNATSSVTVTGLKVATKYTVKVVEYFNIPGPVKYMTQDTISNPIELTTLDYALPTVQATNILFSNVTQTQFDISCTSGNGTNRAIFIAQTSTGSVTPMNNTTYAANTAFGSGTQVGSTGWYCVYNGTGNTVTVTGLNTFNAYNVKVCEYNGTAGLEKYIVSDTVNNPSTYVNNRTDQTITFGPLPAKTYGDTDFDPIATASSGLTVAYASSDVNVATIMSGKIHIVGAGTCNITASQTGDNNFNPAQNVVQPLTVTQAANVITFDPLPNKTMIDAPFTLTAAASSGLPVTFTSSTSKVATVSGNTVTIVGLGTDTITAIQAGNNNYVAATTVKQTFSVSKSLQTITFNALPTFKNTDPDYQLGATASSGLRVIYKSSDLSVAAIQGDLTNDFIHIFGFGTTTITASQPGNDFYEAAASVSQTVTVTNATDVPQLTDGEVLVYPNPASDKVTVSFGKTSSNATIGVYSLTGQQMSLVKADGSQTDIDVSSFKSGIYIIKIMSTDGIIVKQIVKQ